MISRVHSFSSFSILAFEAVERTRERISNLSNCGCRQNFRPSYQSILFSALLCLLIFPSLLMVVSLLLRVMGGRLSEG